MRPARIIAAAIVLAAVVAITGWTAYSIAERRPAATAQPPGAALPREPSPSTRPPSRPEPDTPTWTTRPPTHRPDPTPVDRQALIYTAVLRQYLTSGDHSFGNHRFPEVFVLDHTVAGAGAPGHKAPGGGPIPPGVQRAITHALTDVGPLTFVASRDAVIDDARGCAHVRGDGILVTLGPVDGSGDRVQVGINGFVACLGADSLTYLVERTGRGWVVSGITAHGPVA